MSNWFHRNPLKATSKVKFDLGRVASSVNARAICSELAKLRENLLSLFRNPANSDANVTETLRKYLSLLLGFVNPPENSQDSESKLRGDIMFKWTNTLQLKGIEPTMEPDALFEFCSMLFEFALWLMKHGACIAAKEDIGNAEALEVLKAFRQAAGVVDLLRTTYVPNLSFPPSVESDLSSDILQAYLYQCLGESQEVILARAMEGKQRAALIAGLAKHTAEVYEKARLCIQPYPAKSAGKWQMYFVFKRKCCETCAFVYFADHLLSEEKAGAGVAAIAEARKFLEEAEEASKQYSKSDGVGMSSKPAEHSFFRSLGRRVESTKSKLERENSLFFNQRPPLSAPLFDLKPTYGVVGAKDPGLELTMDSRWADTYVDFDRGKLVESLAERDAKAKEAKEKTDRDAPVQPVAETPIFSTDKAPKTESGCSLQ